VVSGASVATTGWRSSSTGTAMPNPYDRDETAECRIDGDRSDA
jgi:hypothetical protein